MASTKGIARCRCSVPLQADGTCRYGCPPKHARQFSRRTTVGVKPKRETLISADAARAGIEKAVPTWRKETERFNRFYKKKRRA